MNRKLHWPGFVNARSLDGIAVDGGAIRAGALYRTERAGLEVEAGADTLRALNQAGVSCIIDLRTGDEYGDPHLITKQHPGYVNLPIQADDGTFDVGLTESLGMMYADILDSSGDSLVRAIRGIVTAPPGGVMIHCTAGKDRTGLVIALVLGVLGASDDDMCDDYTLTRDNFLPFHDAWVQTIDDPQFKEYLLTHDTNAPREAMVDALAHIRQRYGTIALYLKQHGFGSDDVDALRARVVDGIRVRSGAFVRRGDAIALIRRDRDAQTYFTTPGGGIEPGETAREACIREVCEELGIRCVPSAESVLRLEYSGGIQLFFEATTEETTLTLGGPEAARQTDVDRHTPVWVDIAELTDLDVRPSEARQYLASRQPGALDDVDIRQIRDRGELDAVCAVIGGAEYPRMAVDDWRFDLVRDAWDTSAEYDVVAVREGEILGGAVSRVLEDGVRVAVLGIDQRYQRAGLGGRLLAQIVRRAEERGQNRVSLGSVAEVTGFYARQGFAVEATYGFTTVFEKILSEPSR